VGEEDIRLCAYCKWETAGRPGGDGVNFWLEAEIELRQGRGDAAKRKDGKESSGLK
jgi:hypothetical protein